MDKIFTAFLIRFVKPIVSLIGRKNVLTVLAGLILAHSSLTVDAQESTFYESFDATPMGEVPEGWKWYSLGGGSGNNWVRSTYGFFGPKIMTSGVEYAIPGEIDEDWLVTPQITPRAGDHLIFDAGQEYVWDDYGSTYHILISTASSNRADFTETLVSWTEPEFPGYLYEDRLFVDLSAYEGIPIYIAFIHKNPETGEGADPDLPPPRIENWYLDNVWVRNVQPMDYSGGEIFGSYTSVIRVAQSKTSVIIGFIVRAAGDTGSADITSMTFTTGGASPVVSIKEATLYTTYGDSFISTDDEAGIVNADVFGTVSDPGNEFTIEGNQLLERGDTYFWLMYTLEADEKYLTYPYPEVDATFETVVVNGVAHETTVSTTAGAHPVVPHTPINDNYANAIELPASATVVRSGSYNTRATFETEFEKLAYCAEPFFDIAKDGSNSVWWHFRAPGNGMINVDLSTSNFNTLLLIQDTNFDQLACNKDIDQSAFVFQSKITGFEVEAEKEYYIRVTGEGLGPGDPNAASGVIHMDFSFTTPVGVEEEESAYELSPLYPNPAEHTVYTDLTLQRSAEVVLEVVDMLGQRALTSDKGLLAAGTYEHLPLEVGTLSPGTYIVRLRGSPKGKVQKLIILKK
jgi:hypothetical protein